MSTTAVRYLLDGAVLGQAVPKILTSGKLDVTAFDAACSLSPPKCRNLRATSEMTRSMRHLGPIFLPECRNLRAIRKVTRRMRHFT